MMGSSLLLFHLLVILGSALADAEVPSTTAVPTSPQPVYKPPEQPPGYISQPMYGYPEAYGGSLYDALFYPPSVPYKPPAYVDQPPPSNYVSSLMPAAQGAVQFVLKVLAKFGLFLIGGVALLVVGGIFTTAVCSLTPICVISFPLFGGIDKESVRSLMTPDKISAAAALVQDAIGKYKRLQRAVDN